MTGGPSSAQFDWRGAHAALIVAHPGHELRVHHWLEIARPGVLVLTDGSGRIGRSRLGSTAAILERIGTKAGPVWGRFTDVCLYEAMLQGRTNLFVSLLEEIVDWLHAERIEYVVGDALEGFNSTHDVCRYLIGAACELAERRGYRRIQNFAFPLDGIPDDGSQRRGRPAIRLRLDRDALERKLAAAAAYPEMREEVAAALNRFGPEAFAVEVLHPAANDHWRNDTQGTPFYETHGERQHAAGHYTQVIRRRDHLLPIAEALWAATTAHA